MRPVFIFIISLIICAPHSAFPQSPVVIKDEAYISMGKNIALLADPSGNLHIRDILADKGSFEFKKSNDDIPVFAATDSYVWVRFSFINQTGKDVWLSVDNPATDSVFFYQVVGGEVKNAKLSGDKVPYQHRDIRSNRILFNLGSDREEQTVYIRLNIRLPRQFPIAIFTSAGLIEKQSVHLLQAGIFYGFLCILVLYNLFLWVMVKDSAYLLYSFYIFCSGLVLFHFDGLAYTYLWPSFTQINDHPAILSCLSIFAAGAFVSEFLNLRRSYPVLFRGLIVLSAGLFSATVLSLSGFKFLALTLSQLIAFAASLFFLLIGILMYRKGIRHSRFYLAAWWALIVGVLVFLLKDLGLLPYNTITANALKFGVGGEALLMVFALGDKINFYKAEREKAIRERKILEAVHHSEMKAAETERTRIKEELTAAEHMLFHYTENLRRKNLLITRFKADLHQMEEQLRENQQSRVRSEYLEKLMDATILTDDDWVQFRKLFDKVHTGFMLRLKEKYPQMTESEIRLLTLMKLQLTPTEMAGMLGVTTEAIRKGKQRLRKKLSFAAEDSLQELIAGV